MYMCLYVCIIIKACDKISSTDPSSKQLQINRQTKKNTMVSGET